MSTNYYVNTRDGGEIHLGKWGVGGFTFRAATDLQEPAAYEAWLAQLDLGEIVSESGYTLTRAEMIEQANDQVPPIQRSIKLSDVRNSPHHFVQADNAGITLAAYVKAKAARIASELNAVLSELVETETA